MRMKLLTAALAALALATLASCGALDSETLEGCQKRCPAPKVCRYHTGVLNMITGGTYYCEDAAAASKLTVPESTGETQPAADQPDGGAD